MSENPPEEDVLFDYFYNCGQAGLNVTSENFVNWIVSQDIDYSTFDFKPVNLITAINSEVRNFLRFKLPTTNIGDFLQNVSEISILELYIHDIANGIFAKFFSNSYPSLREELIHEVNLQDKIVQAIKLETTQIFRKHIDLIFRKSLLVSQHAEVDSLCLSYYEIIPMKSDARETFIKLYKFLCPQNSKSLEINFPGLLTLKLEALFSITESRIPQRDIENISSMLLELDKKIQNYQG